MNDMKNLLKAVLMAALLTLLAACGGDKEAEKPKQAEVVLTVPADPSDSQGWKIYLSGVVKKNMEGIRSSPYMYYLPSASAEDFEEQFNRQLDNVGGVVARGVLPGNMLAFGSPESARMADLVIEAFSFVSAGSMKDVRVLFIGNSEDAERVKAAIEPSGATFVFHQAQ
jgi:hypothetical protein